MSGFSAAALANEVRSATLEQIWRQWRAVGGSASGSKSANAMVDPEALILMSLWLMDWEQRLADVTASWVSLNASLVGIQRLRNLHGAFPPLIAPRLSAVAEVAIEDAKDLRWESVKGNDAADLALRSNKARAIEVQFRSWPTAMLQLRRGMGVGAKADVLSFLLSTNVLGGDLRPDWANVAIIAKATGYTTRAVRRAADDLADARFIRSLETVKSDKRAQRMYSARTLSWAQLLEVTPYEPGWAYWKELFLFIIELLTWLAELEGKQISPYAQDVRAREIIEAHKTVLLQNRVMDAMEFAESEVNLAYLEKTVRNLANWMSNRG